MPQQEQPDAQELVLSQDPLVEHLLPDPSQEHPNVRVLAGFVGNSTQEGNVRLYLTPALDVYLEIPRQAIVKRQSLASEQNPLAGTMLWVKQDADVVLHTRTNLRQRQGRFLAGNLSQTGTPGMVMGEAVNLAAFGPGGLRNPIPMGSSFSLICVTTPFCIREAQFE